MSHETRSCMENLLAELEHLVQITKPADSKTRCATGEGDLRSQVTGQLRRINSAVERVSEKDSLVGEILALSPGFRQAMQRVLAGEATDFDWEEVCCGELCDSRDSVRDWLENK